MMSLNNITVNIPVLNEEKNIKDCILSIKKSGIKKIIVIDGGSTDQTVNILKRLKVKIILAKKRGLAYQRNLGIKNTTTKFVALIDADMRATKNSFKLMLKDLEDSIYAGVEAKIKTANFKKNYFDNAYQEIMNININKQGTRRMIGTPTLWKSKILKFNNFDPFFTGPSDDTDLCYRIYKKGYLFSGSKAIIKHVHRSSFAEYFKKYIWYGKGDAQFVQKHPERFLSIIKHQLFNYPIKFSFYAILRNRAIYIPFMIFAGYLRFIGMNYELILRALKTKDKIYST
jgi:glycosyltransferase involved in cell wall biosynthesis